MIADLDFDVGPAGQLLVAADLGDGRAELELELGLELQLAVEQKLVLAPAAKLAQPARLVVALEMGLARVPVV